MKRLYLWGLVMVALLMLAWMPPGVGPPEAAAQARWERPAPYYDILTLAPATAPGDCTWVFHQPTRKLYIRAFGGGSSHDIDLILYWTVDGAAVKDTLHCEGHTLVPVYWDLPGWGPKVDSVAIDRENDATSTATITIMAFTGTP